jgi:hypothetical protein
MTGSHPTNNRRANQIFLENLPVASFGVNIHITLNKNPITKYVIVSLFIFFTFPRVTTKIGVGDNSFTILTIRTKRHVSGFKA